MLSYFYVKQAGLNGGFPKAGEMTPQGTRPMSNKPKSSPRNPKAGKPQGENKGTAAPAKPGGQPKRGRADATRR